MATRFYFHAANSLVSGTLPSTEQNTALSPTRNVDAQTVNRAMDTAIGTSSTHTALTHNTIASTATTTMYFTRFVSDPLAAQTIAANTWTLNFATSENNGAANFPGAGGSQTIPITCYVWRPSTGAKVGDILNGTSAAAFNEVTGPAVNAGTFSGSSLAVQAGDVLCFEFIFTTTQTNGTSRLVGIYFDGNTVNTTDDAAVTAQASFLETPGTVTFGSPSTIDMTLSGQKNVANKFITKV